ncbi:IS607 family element RNA-guided endonuclease TnpB [Nocardia sp. NPDC051030]|uniref:IS607 family element RNA-guided endonuclease TnpB n=1 Tax=Nocardia sp. NPDC051030 TaxID=3155162 RepID=UPI0034230606
MKVSCAYKYALDPNATAETALYEHCCAARFVFNHMLGVVKNVMDQRGAEVSYGIDPTELTPTVNWSAYGLRKIWNERKHVAAVNRATGRVWWADYSKEAYSSACADVAAGLKNWRESKSGKRKGPKVGFPRFKSKRSGHLPSVRFTTGAIGVDGRTHVVLPVIGRVKTHESTRKLARRIEAGTARILAATIKRQRGRWFVVFTCEVERTERVVSKPRSAVGVDLGVKTLAVTSDGVEHPNPKHLSGELSRLRGQSRRVSRRQGPDRRTGFAGSNRWHRANAARNRTHHQIADARGDGLHKLTTALARTYGAIGVEDLNVAGMLRNTRLARAIADCGFGELLRQLEYKTRWRATVFAVADRWYPSSKTCSRCARVKAKLSLAERMFVCEWCGLVLDRDLNAARNLAHQIGILFPEWLGEVKRGRGGEVRPIRGQSPVNRLPDGHEPSWHRELRAVTPECTENH